MEGHFLVLNCCWPCPVARFVGVVVFYSGPRRPCDLDRSFRRSLASRGHGGAAIRMKRTGIASGRPHLSKLSVAGLLPAVFYTLSCHHALFNVSSTTELTSSARRKTVVLTDSSTFSSSNTKSFMVETDLGGPKSLTLIRPTKGSLGLLVDGTRVCS